MLSACAALTFIAALVARGASASLQVARDEPHLAALRDSTAQWASVIGDLERITASLAEIDRFGASRRSATELLGDIADVLPDSSAMITFRVDSTGGGMTVLSTAAATVIPRLVRVADIVDPRLSGAVTRETGGGPQLQRIAIRFRSPTSRGLRMLDR